MILLQNPSVPTPTTPVEIDAAILDIKSELETGLIWLTNGYGRAYKNLDITNGERVYFPEIYLGKQSGSFRYTNISVWGMKKVKLYLLIFLSFSLVHNGCRMSKHFIIFNYIIFVQFLGTVR